jgi:mono/diheme cytochrome c family protein
MMTLKLQMSRPSFFTVTAFLAASVLTSVLVSAAPQTKADDEHPKFPAGEGRELTIKVCSSCHDAELLAEQELDAEGWKNTVSQMAGMGATATEEQLEQITAYLIKAFPPPAK